MYPVLNRRWLVIFRNHELLSVIMETMLQLRLLHPVFTWPSNLVKGIASLPGSFCCWVVEGPHGARGTVWLELKKFAKVYCTTCRMKVPELRLDLEIVHKKVDPHKDDDQRLAEALLRVKEEMRKHKLKLVA
jgi:hypothetical protein